MRSLSSSIPHPRSVLPAGDLPPAVSGSAVPADLPDEVFGDSPTQAVTHDASYVVRDGALFQKRQVDGATWQRVGPPDARQVYADADTVVVVDGKRNVHTFQPRMTVSGALGLNVGSRWFDTWGSPEKEVLTLPSEGRFKCFALGRRSQLSSEYVEDPLGNKIKAGSGFRNDAKQGFTNGLTHLYALSADGKRLYYSDSGLPPGFDRQFDMPRGFTATTLAAGGCTVGLLGEDGTLYTALREFDLSGSDPMLLRYSFDKLRRDQDPLAESSMSGIVNLPREPWAKQPRLPLHGLAEATRHLTIVQTGGGNASRELRIQGRNASGQYGYWNKGVREPRWSFRVTGERYAARDVLSGFSSQAKVPLATRWPGQGKVGGVSAVKAEIDDFDLTRSPAKVTLTTPDGGVAHYQLYTVDAWSPFKANDPGLDGTPKLMLGHLQLVDANEAAKPLLDTLGKLAGPFNVNVQGTGSDARIFADDVELDFGKRAPVTAAQRSHAAAMAGKFGAAAMAAAAVKSGAGLLSFIPALGVSTPTHQATTVAPRILFAQANMWRREAMGS